MPPALQLPDRQNWSCLGCGRCCRVHTIVLTGDEKERIEKLDWRGQNASLPQPWLESSSDKNSAAQPQLARQTDGACVFLTGEGRCLLQNLFGAEAKPRACRIFPFTFQPAGKKHIAAGLRFGCPSAASNRGRPLAQQNPDLQALAHLAIPPRANELPPPPVKPGCQLDWPAFLSLVHALGELLNDESVPLSIRWLQILAWTKTLETYEIVESDLPEVLPKLHKLIRAGVTAKDAAKGRPRRLTRAMFRLTAAQYARLDAPGETTGSWRHRWQLLRWACAFALGWGRTPSIQPELARVPFRQLDVPLKTNSSETEELLTRFFRIKISSLQFCGAAVYNMNFLEGIKNLALLHASILWLARWIALGRNREEPITEDLEQALTFADHNFAHSPGLGTFGARLRLNLLFDSGELAGLLGD
ncbi:MAG: YkgJ family cysteine cluster protein [Verrucomicrobiae bacterium]|nr:YkgJ family cysteine cluster protein [Verrucomicrobiae bacterium]